MPAILKSLCRSWDNLKNKSTWLLQAHQFCFSDFPKTSNNYQNRGHVFWRSTKHYSSTENHAHLMLCFEDVPSTIHLQRITYIRWCVLKMYQALFFCRESRTFDYVFWRCTKHYSSTDNHAHSMMYPWVGALQNMLFFFLKNSWFLCNSQHFH